MRAHPRGEGGLLALLRTAFVDKYLDPASSLGEVVFGLIMTLTFTLGAGILVQEEGADAARELLIATIGCNVAWGIIDAALYVIGQIFERGRRRRLLHTIQRAASAQAALSHVASELDELLAPVTAEGERRALYERIAERVRASALPTNRVTRADLMGGLASFWLVFLASLPAALPFLLFQPAHLAMRISNLLLLAMLFLVGWRWAGYTILRPWVAGLSLLLAGVILVALAIALGG
jgi:hypothetical protein